MSDWFTCAGDSVAHVVDDFGGCGGLCGGFVSRRAWWTVVFLGVTAVAVGMELWASFDGDASTDPWTDLIVRYVPGEVTALLIGGLCLWLIVHFGLRYWRRHKAVVGQKPTVEKEETDEPENG